MSKSTTMNKVPREAVEFARMVVRAFYPTEFVILTDAVLRCNNYCAHQHIALNLRMQPKELRQILTRMVHARLMRNDKRTQKKINNNDERKPSRTVNTEYWYVPLAEVVETFMYRVHILTRNIEAKRSSQVDRQKHICRNCRQEYQIIEIVNNIDEATGEFICERMGVRADRRNLPCGGVIDEVDNSKEIHETERLRQMLNEQLRVLRERAAICAKMDIPYHPLLHADEKTWGDLVPETVGAHGEKVDEDGIALNENGFEDAKAKAAKNGGLESFGQGSKDDDGTIAEKPSWFKESGGDDADAEWDLEQENMLRNESGTANAFNNDNDDQYYEQYLREHLGVQAEDDEKRTGDASTEAPPQSIEAPEMTDAPSAEAEGEIRDDSIEEKEEEAPQPEQEDVFVSVAGRQVKLSEVTDEMTETMTKDEFEKYFALANRMGGADDDDMEDEFE